MNNSNNDGEPTKEQPEQVELETTPWLARTEEDKVENSLLNGEEACGDEAKYAYGWSNFQPKCLQFMSNRKAFLIVFCMTCILQGTFHTYFVAVITTLEKLFSIPSKTTGFLMSATEIGQVSSSLLLPYYASSRHRPHWIAYGSFIFCLATLCTITPHLLHPPKINEVSKNTSEILCADSTFSLLATNETLCTAADDRETPPFYLFGILFLCLLCIGLGQTAVYTLGIPYLDDNVASRDSPLYFSITIGVRILGPVFGFILGSFCTRLFIYPGKEPKGMTPQNPQWLGAWWLGMLLISSLLCCTSFLVYGFPKSLKKKISKPSIVVVTTTMTEVTKLPVSEPVLPQGSPGDRLVAATGEDAMSPMSTSFTMTLKRLLKNRILLLRMCSSVLHLLPISGLYTFLPKYLESQFRLAAFEASIYTGIAGILVMGVGIFFSGLYIRVREPDARTVALWVAISAFVYAGGMAALMFIGCDQQDFVLGNIRQPACETDFCSSCPDIYDPICAGNQTYLSYCHAGCRFDNSTQQYDCECAGPDSPPMAGLCPSNCKLFHLFTCIFIFIVLVHSSSEVGSMLLTLRCVHPSDKAMALGLVQCAIGLMGNVPCPIIYGSIVDSACDIWGHDCLRSTGNCWHYEPNSFRFYFFGTTSVFMLLASLIDMSIYFKAKDIQIISS